MRYLVYDAGRVVADLAHPSPDFPDAVAVSDDDPAVLAFRAQMAHPQPESISDRQFFQQLAIDGEITPDEALAAATIGAIPQRLSEAIDRLPEAYRFAARMEVAGATVFSRRRQTTLSLAAAMDPPWDAARLDALWTAAALL